MTGAPLALLQSRWPSSPKTMFVPEPVVIESSSGPPNTIWSPDPVEMTSLPPTPGFRVSMEASVSGRFAKCGPLNGFATTAPSSPRTTFVPVPSVILSPAAPPTTRLLPVPVVIVSTPPTPEAMVADCAISLTPACWAQRMYPLSPYARFVPSPRSIVSSAWPPKTTLFPSGT